MANWLDKSFDLCINGSIEKANSCWLDRFEEMIQKWKTTMDVFDDKTLENIGRLISKFSTFERQKILEEIVIHIIDSFERNSIFNPDKLPIVLLGNGVLYKNNWVLLSDSDLKKWYDSYNNNSIFQRDMNGLKSDVVKVAEREEKVRIIKRHQNIRFKLMYLNEETITSLYGGFIYPICLDESFKGTKKIPRIQQNPTYHYVGTCYYERDDCKGEDNECHICLKIFCSKHFDHKHYSYTPVYSNKKCGWPSCTEQAIQYSNRCIYHGNKNLHPGY